MHVTYLPPGSGPGCLLSLFSEDGRQSETHLCVHPLQGRHRLGGCRELIPPIDFSVLKYIQGLYMPTLVLVHDVENCDKEKPNIQTMK